MKSESTTKDDGSIVTLRLWPPRKADKQRRWAVTRERGSRYEYETFATEEEARARYYELSIYAERVRRQKNAEQLGLAADGPVDRSGQRGGNRGDGSGDAGGIAP